MFNLNLFKAKPSIEVGAIAVMSGRKILMGKRRDKGHRWTNVGGHIEKGETPIQGAVRELKEEAGIDVKASKLKPMGFVDVTAIDGKKIRVHAFKLNYDGPTTMLDDPDQEVFRWQWFNLDAMPDHVMDNLHAKKNILLEKLKAKRANSDLNKMIKKVGSVFVLFSKDGKKKLGHGTKEEMEQREREVNYFKHIKKAGDDLFDHYWNDINKEYTDEEIDLLKAKKMAVGTIRTYKNGKKYQKQADGTWREVRDKKEAKGDDSDIDIEKFMKENAYKNIVYGGINVKYPDGQIKNYHSMEQAKEGALKYLSGNKSTTTQNQLISNIPKSIQAKGYVVKNIHGTRFLLTGWDKEEEVFTAVKYGDRDKKDAEIFAIDPAHKDDIKDFSLSGHVSLGEKTKWFNTLDSKNPKKSFGKKLHNIHGTEFVITGYDKEEGLWLTKKSGDINKKKAEIYAIDPTDKADQKGFNLVKESADVNKTDSSSKDATNWKTYENISMGKFDHASLDYKQWEAKVFERDGYFEWSITDGYKEGIKLGYADTKEQAKKDAIKAGKEEIDRLQGKDTFSEAKSKIKDVQGTPRGDANANQKELDKDYEFARKSKVGNKGEDLKGSARHKRNEFKDLADIEKSGRGAELVTRDNLLKLYPPELMDGLSPKNYEIRLTAYLALKKFPAKPKLSKYPSESNEVNTWLMKNKETGEEQLFTRWNKLSESDRPKYELVREIPDKDRDKYEREKFYNSFMEFKDHIEKVVVPQLEREKHESELLTANREQKSVKDINFSGYGNHLLDRLRTVVSGEIKKLRKVYQYDNQANNLINYVNNILYKGRQRATNTVAHDLKRFHELSTEKWDDANEKKLHDTMTDEQKLDAVMSIMEGKTVDKAFSVASGRSRKDEFKPATLYMGKAERKGPTHKGLNTQKGQEKFLLDKSKMRGVQWGNSVTDDEREHHLKHVSNSFKDLTDILGLPEQMGSFNGRLGIAIGARGKGTALANYEPSTHVINLTRKNGVGSLGHEWGHFFDNVLAKISGGGDFMTRGYYYGSKENKPPIREAFDNLRDSEGMKEFKEQVYTKAREMNMSQAKRNYWTSAHEMFARSFEKYLYHKLDKLGRKNTYLCKDVDHGLWPSKEQVEKMTPYFDAIFDTFKNSDMLKKAIDYMIDLRKEEQPYFKNKFWRYPKQQTWSSERKADWHKDQMEFHDADTPEYKSHQSAYKRWKKQNDLGKSVFIIPDLNKKVSNEGSRGGRIIGHTKSGNPIYAGDGQKGEAVKDKPKFKMIGEKKKTEKVKQVKQNITNKTDNNSNNKKPKVNDKMQFYPSQARKVIHSFLQKYPKLDSVISDIIMNSEHDAMKVFPAIAQVLASHDPDMAMSFTKAMQKEYNYDLTKGLIDLELTNSEGVSTISL